MLTHQYDLVLPHSDSVAMVKANGMEAFVKWISAQYQDYNFYSCSQDWIEDRKYICKLKGGNGDLIIGWAENILEIAKSKAQKDWTIVEGGVVK